MVAAEQDGTSGRWPGRCHLNAMHATYHTTLQILPCTSSTPFFQRSSRKPLELAPANLHCHSDPLLEQNYMAATWPLLINL
jgi:hypothetical protein